MSEVSEISDDDWAVWRVYVGAGRQLVAELDRRLQAEAGITHPEYTVMLALAEAPDRRRRAGELADILAWEKSRVSHQISRMESRGLVDRTECTTDGRGTWIGLTADGRRSMLQAMRAHADDIRELFFDKIADDEKAAIKAATTRMLEQLHPATLATLAPKETALIP